MDCFFFSLESSNKQQQPTQHICLFTVSLFSTKASPIIDGLNIGSDRNSTTSSSAKSDSITNQHHSLICSSNFGLGFDNCFTIFRQTDTISPYCLSNSTYYDYYDELDSSDESYNLQRRNTTYRHHHLDYKATSNEKSRKRTTTTSKYSRRLAFGGQTDPFPVAPSAKSSATVACSSQSSSPSSSACLANHSMPTALASASNTAQPSITTITTPLPATPPPLVAAASEATTSSDPPRFETPIDLSRTAPASSSDVASLNNVYSRLHQIYPLTTAGQDKKSLVFWKKLILKDSAYQYFDLSDDSNTERSGRKRSETKVNSADAESSQLSGECSISESQKQASSLITSLFKNHPTLLSTPSSSKLRIIDLAVNYSPNRFSTLQQQQPEQKVPRKKGHEPKVKCSCGEAEIASVRSLNSATVSSSSDVESFPDHSSTIHSDNDEIVSSVPTIGQEITYHSSESEDKPPKLQDAPRPRRSKKSSPPMQPELSSDSSEVVHSESESPKSSFQYSNNSTKPKSSYEKLNFEPEVNGKVNNCSSSEEESSSSSDSDSSSETSSSSSSDTEEIAETCPKSPPKSSTLPQKKSLIRLYDLEQKLSTHSDPETDEEQRSSAIASALLASGAFRPRRRRSKTNCENGQVDPVEFDAEFAKSLQFQEYLAARPARRQKALVASDRLHEMQLQRTRFYSTEVKRITKRKQSSEEGKCEKKVKCEDKKEARSEAKSRKTVHYG